MGTPLNIITGNAQYLLRKTSTAGAARHSLEQVVSQAQRIASMIRRLLDLSRPAPVEPVPLDLGALVRQTLEMLPARRDITVTTSIDDSAPLILADPKQLEHALLNLVVNAQQAMPDGGTLSITVGSEPQPGRPATVTLQVRDSGSGIAAEDLRRVFEPFFTTKAPDEGTGLGLAIVERIVRQHGGTIEVSSEPERGAAFTIRLRAQPPPAGGSNSARRDDA
jgi:signal transduction histidine kinase